MEQKPAIVDKQKNRQIGIKMGSKSFLRSHSKKQKKKRSHFLPQPLKNKQIAPNEYNIIHLFYFLFDPLMRLGQKSCHFFS